MRSKLTPHQKSCRYNCTGYCYGCNTDLPMGHPDRLDMCHCADICPETRNVEFISSLIAVIAYVFLLVLTVGLLLLPVIIIIVSVLHLLGVI